MGVGIWEEEKGMCEGKDKMGGGRGIKQWEEGIWEEEEERIGEMGEEDLRKDYGRKERKMGEEREKLKEERENGMK